MHGHVGALKDKDFGQGWPEMDSPAYSIRLETESGKGSDDRLVQCNRKIVTVIVSAVCGVVVLLLGGLAGGVWYYDKSVEKGAFERTRTRTNALSGGSVFVAAGTSKTTFGLSQTGASGQSRSQTSAAGPASEDGGGSMKAVQVEDGSFLGRARLFYANNRRAVLIAIAVSVVVVIAIVATVTAVMLLQQQQQAVSQVTTNDQHTDNLEPHPEATRSVNVPLAVGLSVGIFVVLSIVTIVHMVGDEDVRPKTVLQGIFHFLYHTIFVSPFLLFGLVAVPIRNLCKKSCKFWPLGVLLVLIFVCALSCYLLFLLGSLLACIPCNVFMTSSFRKEMAELRKGKMLDMLDIMPEGDSSEGGRPRR